MSKQRLSVSVDVSLIQAAEDAVGRGRAPNISAWVGEALRLKVERDRKLEALAEFVAGYEATHGEITAEEIRAATRSARTRAIAVHRIAPRTALRSRKTRKSR
jgi:Arc/MetJ-type ribon-helix-helix transcriptional regulator